MSLSGKDKQWELTYKPVDPSVENQLLQISRECGISKILATLLRNRGYGTTEQVREFFNSAYRNSLIDPFLMKDIDKAVDRIDEAVAKHQRVTIYGDYDVDGVTSVTVLYLYLKKSGIDVSYYIPSRSKEGYGLSAGAVKSLADEGVELIITVDTGITANDEADIAAECGIDMIITDHHECHGELPRACAVVNIHRPDCPYPFKNLAGVGVVFKLICACEIKKSRAIGISDDDAVQKIVSEYADLVAIGTVADVMPIVGENRFIISAGLKMAANTERLGLKALFDAISPNGKNKPINSSFIGYGIAPRINAAGRISSATKAVELLLAETDEKATEMANQLCEINAQRQLEENRIAEQAYKMIEQEIDLENTRVIVLSDDSWNQGIIGIVASRITEKYGLPSILITFDGSTRGYASSDDQGKGSGRSIKGMNLVSAMNECKDLLVRYGGHELAAGLTITRGNIGEFRKRINQYASEILDEEALTVKCEADCEIQTNDITMQLALELDKLEPFGVSNPQPMFVLRDLSIMRIVSLGTGKHSKFILTKDGMSFNAVWFGMPVSKLGFLVSDSVDVMFQLNINDFRNVKSLQMIITDMRICERYENEVRQYKQRFNEIQNGADFTGEEDVIPTRDDMAMLYTMLRSEFRIGHNTFSDRTIMSMINQSSYNHINYIKMRYIITVFREMKICGVVEPSDGIYIFDMYNNIGKTNLEKSAVLNKLKEQLKNS